MGPPDKKRKGTFLEPDMVPDLIETAVEWKEELRRRRRADQCFGRRSLVTVLCLCGPRISELVAADGGDFDLGQGLWRIPDSKTAAGVRLVEATDFAATEIRAHVAQKKADGRPAGAGDPMWVTSMCFWAKRELPWVMGQIGHEGPRMTGEVCLMRFPDEPKRSPGSGR